MGVLGAASVGLGLLPLLLGEGGAGWSGGASAGPVRRANRTAARTVGRAGVLVGACWAIAVVLALWTESSDAAGTSLLALPPRLLLAYGGQVAAGRGLLLTLACAVLFAVWHLVLPRRPGGGPARYPELALGLAALGVLAGPVTGHTGGHNTHDLAVLAVALHVVGACLWMGGLAAVVAVLARAPRLLVSALSRFSSVAGYCALTVGVSGVLSAVLRLPTSADLVRTGYGQLVLAKVCCLAVLVLLGRRARRVVLPRIAASAARLTPGSARNALPLARWLGAELVVMAVVLGLASALAGSAP
jgi:putative copper resistance protein D